MAELRVRDVAIPRPTNVTSCIQKTEASGRLELTQSMVQLLHTNGQFTGLPHKDPTKQFGQFASAQNSRPQGGFINLMPTSLYKKRGLGNPKPTTIILQLADRSVARPEGVVEDVLVQVGSLIFPVDFVVLNFEPDPKVSFILGRPFLATGRAMIDVAVGQLTILEHDKVEVFDVYKALKLLDVYEELSAITVIDLEAEVHYIASKDPLERVLVGYDIYGDIEA
ncbi:hypothetical protein R3W88_011605 [Solanum pinnatisectum]|uniref:Reverse transcriptase domain-containing protein n=1 Tax=Solanum pinnatisectum TaxID=50273 RepID=A0AAV9L6N1_9SOLN|nr:hypothetical protein R3W88_011605 [Solanum pinnatisectum]